MSRRRLILSLPLVLAAACTEPNTAFTPAETVCEVDEYFVGQPFTLAEPDQLDILFVVDDSPGMGPKQELLAAAMPAFIEALEQTDGLDWRFGVTTTDLSAQGALQVGDCPGPANAIVRSGDRAAPENAACNVLLGEDGWDIEQGLEAARRSILNAEDLFRDDARRLIVFFADEDDCTAQESLDRSDPENCLRQPEALVDVSQYAAYFASGAHPRGGSPLSVVAIVPPEAAGPIAEGAPIEPGCTGAGPAFTGDRYRAVVDRLANRTPSFATSICAPSFAPALQRILDDVVAEPVDRLCASLPMTGAPRSVEVSSGTGDTVTLDENGDYLSLGAVSGCDTGAVAISADAHGGELGNEVEVRYCTDTDPSSL